MGQAINYILDNAGAAVCFVLVFVAVLTIQFSPRDYYAEPTFDNDEPVHIPETKPKPPVITKPKTQIDPTVKGELLMMGYDEALIDKVFYLRHSQHLFLTR
jgi:hypothetical protein